MGEGLDRDSEMLMRSLFYTFMTGLSAVTLYWTYDSIANWISRQTKAFWLYLDKIFTSIVHQFLRGTDLLYFDGYQGEFEIYNQTDVFTDQGPSVSGRNEKVEIDIAQNPIQM